MKTPALLLSALIGCVIPATGIRSEEEFSVTKRLRVETGPGSGEYGIEERAETWKGAETAVIACDMWDAHHCLVLGGSAFVVAKDTRPRVLVMVSEPEYGTERTLPAFAKDHLARDFRIDFAVTDPANANGFLGLGPIGEADVLVVSVRRRAPPAEQMAAIRKFVASGKPVLGIRTASHAFSLRGVEPPAGHAVWDDWDAEVFGGSYHGHHGAEVRTFAAVVAGAGGHPVMAGMPEGEFATGGSLYEVLPLKEGAEVLVEGRAEGIAEKQPVAWTHRTPAGGRVFYTSLGHEDDFADPGFTRMLRNAVYWALEMPVPVEREGAGKPARAPGTPGDLAEDAPAGPLAPADSLRLLRTAPDLEADLVLSDPLIAQPLHLSFDARGRLWLVEYRQYPNPAGLRQLSRDNVWRAVYDRKPPPPPHSADSPFRGQDRISIHEDADGDGVYETHKVFADGLNIATSVAHGRGGIWVTNPPYLLFYPDRDGDDVPDGDPEVRLDGFGLEDTHAVANSLVFGPDGWLYGAQGSTVSASVIRPGIDRPGDGVRTMGQNIWRYHPERKVYEVFAEGGGNAFGVEIDGMGRIYSGHNGGDTRGFHYVQGGYFQKSFNKHGDHSNPHTYGFLPPMRHATVPRFTHQFVIYGSDALPESYRGKLIGVDVLHHNLVRGDVIPDGSSFRTEDLDRPVGSGDPWFRPVMVAEGPDGNLYVADWYDRQVNHYRNHEGQIDPERGRVYRLRAKGAPPAKVPDLSVASDEALVGFLGSANRWQRTTALRLLSERLPVGILEALSAKAEAPSLRELWLLAQAGRWEPGLAARALGSAEASVRMWAVRLSEERAPGDILARMAADDSSPEVLTQLAATARRLPAGQGLLVLAALMRRDPLAADPHLPLMCWWGIEAHCAESAAAVLALFGEAELWSHPLAGEVVAPRLMRRFASEGTSEGWNHCANLFAVAPDATARTALMAGFGEATKGRTLSGLPEALLEELARSDGDAALVIRMRRGDAEALRDALASDSARVIEVFGEVDYPACVPVLIERFGSAGEESVRRACLAALGSYEDERVGESLLGAFPSLDIPMREAVANLLCGRASWARALLDAVEAHRIGKEDIPLPLVRKLAALGDPRVAERARGIWLLPGVAEGAREAEIARITRIVADGTGVPKRGEATFAQRCAACHALFGKGGNVGPDLTSYQRDDLANMLLAIVDPGAEIREGYENVLVTLKDGRVLGGFLAGQDKASVVLRDFAGQSTTLARDRIGSLMPAGVSLMPGGLLGGLDDGSLRDLIAYLRSTTPPF